MRIRVFVLVLVLCCSLFLQTCALADEEISPYYSYTQDVAAGLSISDSGVASCYGRIVVYEMSSEINLNVRLQRKEGSVWVLVKKWSDTVSGARQLVIDKDYAVTEGTYRVVSSGIVTNADGDFETVSCITNPRTYP